MWVYRPVQMSQNQNFFGRSQSQTRLGERSGGGKVQKISDSRSDNAGHSSRGSELTQFSLGNVFYSSELSWLVVVSSQKFLLTLPVMWLV